MKLKTPCKYISRKILKVINTGGKYHNWMKNYLYPKEFYLLKNTGISKLNQNTLYKKIETKLFENNIIGKFQRVNRKQALTIYYLIE